ncbi:MAG: ABC transporter ATP-binding protein, partial [Spirochaetaceae bacterium]|nr:ABC transporter ATP-binding protein [Spirochaetaceae bacterium]
MARNRFDEDELEDRKIDVHIIARLFHWIKPYKKQMILSCLAMLAASAVSLISPLLIKLAIDKAIPQKNMHMLFGLAALLLCNSVIVWRLLVVKLKLMTRAAQKIIVEIRRDIFAKLQALPFTYFDSRPHGKIQIRVVNYVNSLSDLLSNGIIQLVSDLFNIIVILCFMFAIDTRLTLICMAVLPLLLITLLSLKKVQHKAWQQVSYKQSNLNAYLSESLNGMKITQSFSRESINMNIFRSLCNEWKKTWMKAVNINNIIWPVIDNLSTFGVTLVYMAGIQWLGAAVSIGTLVAFSGYIWRFWNPIQNLGNFYNSMVTTGAYMERIFELLDENEDITDKPGVTDLPPIR